MQSTLDRCDNCKSSSAKPKCETVSVVGSVLNVANVAQPYGPEFYRAANILEHLRRAALTGDAVAKARRTERFQEYCNKFVDTLVAFQKDVKKEYGSVEKYRQKRRESFERNQKSYYKKTGVSGSMIPNNIVVLKDVEEGLLVNMGNEEKRLIFYGKGAA